MPDDDRRFGFRLPPFRLPEFFPDDFEVVLPLPARVRGRRVGTRWVLVFALVVDVLDALLVLTVTGPVLLARSFVVFVLAIAVASTLGLLAVWEFVAVLMGASGLTVVPSVTVLVIGRARYARTED